MQRDKFKFYFLLFSCCFCFATLNAQNGKGNSFEATFHFGKIIKHHDFLRFDAPDRTLGINLNYTFQTHGRQPWNELHNYPLFGLSLFYYNFGNNEILGHAISICPNLAIYFYRNPKFSVKGQIGAGLAYLDKPFDRLDNPINNAIGSYLNINLYFMFNANWRLNPQLALNAGFCLTHYSNAALQVPNYGINIPSLTFGVKFTPKPLESEDYIEHKTINKPDKKFGVNLHLGITAKEIKAVGGPTYPIYSVTTEGMYYLSKTNRASLGLEYEYNKAAYVFGHHVYQFESEKEARQQLNRFMFFVADEFLFGHLGLKVQLGIYLNKDAILAPYPIYNKWGFFYHFSKFGKSNTSLYVGTNIKTHIYIADYVSLDFGVTF